MIPLGALTAAWIFYAVLHATDIHFTRTEEEEEEKSVTILEGAEVRIGFYGRGGRDPPRGHFRGCQRPRGESPRLITTSEVGKIL